jgi:hypothetical protein
MLLQEFWCNQILQAAQTEAFVIDSIVAISTLYEHPQFMASFYSNPSGNVVEPATTKFHSEALRHYNRAINTVKQFIESGKASPIMALLSCSLFVCIELIRDNVYVALQLYQKGVALIDQCDANGTPSQYSALLMNIKQIFGRLGALVPAYAHPKLLAMDALPHGQDAFQDLTSARNTLFALMLQSNLFVQEAEEWSHQASRKCNQTETVSDASDPMPDLETMYGVIFRMTIDHPHLPTLSTASPTTSGSSHSADSGGSNDFSFSTPDMAERKVIPHTSPAVDDHSEETTLTTLLHQQSELLQRLEAWSASFEADVKRNEIGTSGDCSYLWMIFHATFIWLSTRLHRSQMIFDQFTHYFAELIRHAEVFLDSQANVMPVFTFEIGATPVLFLAAAKCRIPSLRRRALALMIRAPRKECLHGSASTAEFVRRLVEIEEEGMGLPRPELYNASHTGEQLDDSILPGADRRVHNPGLLRNIHTGAFEMEVERYSGPDSFRLIHEHLPV